MRKKLEKIALEAGQRMQAMQKQGIHVDKKEGIGNYVTDADVAVQQFLQEQLRALLPEAGFAGEESKGQENSLQGLRFIVDPIDGTANFARGIPWSGVSIGLVEGETVLCGAVANPYTKDVYGAERGKGAYRNGERIYASKRPLREALVSAGFTSYSRELTDTMFRMFRALFEKCEDMRSFGAAAPGLCMLGAGMTDVYVELRLQPWDYAAASCIITEAGGRISTLDGSPVSFVRESSVLAAGAACYEEALEICRSLLEQNQE